MKHFGTWLRAVGCLPVFFSGFALSVPISLQGTLVLSAGAANDTFVQTFFVSAASTVTLQSYGHGGSGSAPGGTNLAGAVIPAGGFDPYLSLFTGFGPAATFLAGNDDGPCPPGALSGGFCRDSRLSLALAPGTYTLVVSAFDNMSLAENLGTATLGDGFTGLGNFDPARSNDFAVDIDGTGVVAPGSGVATPTLNAWELAALSLLLAIGAAFARRRVCRPCR